MNTSDTTLRTNRFNASATVLWASAFVIAAMVIIQAGRLPANSAHAQMSTSHGAYRLMTTMSGRGSEGRANELLYVIDTREQVLLVYEIEDARRNLMHLRHGGSLDGMFQQARR